MFRVMDIVEKIFPLRGRVILAINRFLENWLILTFPPMSLC